MSGLVKNINKTGGNVKLPSRHVVVLVCLLDLASCVKFVWVTLSNSDGDEQSQQTQPLMKR